MITVKITPEDTMFTVQAYDAAGQPVREPALEATYADADTKAASLRAYYETLAQAIGEDRLLRNRRMEEKLVAGTACNIAGFKKGIMVEGQLQHIYELPDFVADVDYCDAEAEAWIWSIGRHRQTGKIYAATDTRYYLNRHFECLWLR